MQVQFGKCTFLGFQVRMLLEEENVEGEPKPFQMARNVYTSCMDKEGIERLGTKPLKDTLRVRLREGKCSIPCAFGVHWQR